MRFRRIVQIWPLYYLEMLTNKTDEIKLATHLKKQSEKYECAWLDISYNNVLIFLLKTLNRPWIWPMGLNFLPIRIEWHKKYQFTSVWIWLRRILYQWVQPDHELTLVTQKTWVCIKLRRILCIWPCNDIEGHGQGQVWPGKHL